MAKCRGCGKEIVWGKLLSGKKVPLDPKPAVYFYSMIDEQAERASAGHYVTHFATCPKANDFSASNTKKPQQELEL